MNIDELKQLGEILSSLSENAFDGYMVWVGHMYFDTILSFVLWGVFWAALYKIGMRIADALIFKLTEEQIENEVRKLRNRREEQFDEIGRFINRSGRTTVYSYGNPSSVKDEVVNIMQELAELKRKQQ